MHTNPLFLQERKHNWHFYGSFTECLFTGGFFFNIEHVNINFTTMCWRISLIIIKENQQTPKSFQPCIFGPQPFNISLISSSREQTNSEHMRPGIKKTVMFYIMGCKRAVVFGTTFPLSLFLEVLATNH